MIDVNDIKEHAKYCAIDRTKYLLLHQDNFARAYNALPWTFDEDQSVDDYLGNGGDETEMILLFKLVLTIKEPITQFKNPMRKYFNIVAGYFIGYSITCESCGSTNIFHDPTGKTSVCQDCGHVMK